MGVHGHSGSHQGVHGHTGGHLRCPQPSAGTRNKRAKRDVFLVPLDPAIFYPHFSPRGFLPPLICTKYFVTCVPVSLDPWSVLVPADLDPVEHLVLWLVQLGSSG